MRYEFQVHLLNEAGLKKAGDLAEAFSSLLDAIDALVPGNSREKSLVVTKLQEASFFAKRAIATDLGNQK